MPYWPRRYFGRPDLLLVRIILLLGNRCKLVIALVFGVFVFFYVLLPNSSSFLPRSTYDVFLFGELRIHDEAVSALGIAHYRHLPRVLIAKLLV